MVEVAALRVVVVAALLAVAVLQVAVDLMAVVVTEMVIEVVMATEVMVTEVMGLMEEVVDPIEEDMAAMEAEEVQVAGFLIHGSIPTTTTLSNVIRM